MDHSATDLPPTMRSTGGEETILAGRECNRHIQGGSWATSGRSRTWDGAADRDTAPVRKGVHLRRAVDGRRAACCADCSFHASGGEPVVRPPCEIGVRPWESDMPTHGSANEPDGCWLHFRDHCGLSANSLPAKRDRESGG